MRILKDLDAPIEGRDVLIVEDIVDSGLTLSYLLRTLKARDPASLEVCALLTKPERRKVDLPIRYVGFEIPNRFVIGYGLDHAERFRNLPYVAVLRRAPVRPDNAGSPRQRCRFTLQSDRYPLATLRVSRPPKEPSCSPMSRFFKSAAFPILIVVVLAFFAQKLISPGDRRRTRPTREFLTQVEERPGQVGHAQHEEQHVDVEPKTAPTEASTRPPTRTTPSRPSSTRCEPRTSRST